VLTLNEVLKLSGAVQEEDEAEPGLQRQQRHVDGKEAAFQVSFVVETSNEKQNGTNDMFDSSLEGHVSRHLGTCVIQKCLIVHTLDSQMKRTMYLTKRICSKSTVL